jgi:hypothetical protein
MDLKVRSVSARRHAHGLIADVILQCPKPSVPSVSSVRDLSFSCG